MEMWEPAHRTRAKEVFGRPARIALAAWLLERGETPFHQAEALDSLRVHGETRSAVLQELGRFVTWGLLERSDPGPSERRVFYAVNKSEPLWEAFRAAAKALGLLEQ